jgi:Ca-activated chloride channel family protein
VTSTFGVGANFDEHLMRDLSQAGGGNAWFIEGASQIPEILTAELGEALEVTARSTVLTVTVPAGCSAAPLNRFEHAMDRRTGECRIQLGDLVSEQAMDVVVQLSFPPGEVGRQVEAEFGLASATEGLGPQTSRLTWHFASHRENDGQQRNVEVDRAVAQQYATRARADATEFNRDGDYERARQVLERTARRIESYAGGDAELRAIARSLRDETRVYAEVALSPMALKMSFYISEESSKGSDRSGRARR